MIESHGVRGLRTTRLQHYRRPNDGDNDDDLGIEAAQ
jgi:hypothetical protein